MTDIAKQIRQLRIERGLSQAQLAERLHVTRQTVSSWERGVSHPDLKTLEAMASVYDISLEELLFTKPNGGAKSRPRSAPLSGWFILGSVISYSVLLIFGGAYIAIPLFRALLGGGIQEEWTYVIYWGLILLVAYIAICTCLISEYCTECGGEPCSAESECE